MYWDEKELFNVNLSRDTMEKYFFEEGKNDEYEWEIVSFNKKEAGEIVGVIIVGLPKNYYENRNEYYKSGIREKMIISTLQVKEEFRGKGLGTELFFEAIEWLSRKIGSTPIRYNELHIHATDAGIRFFDKFSFLHPVSMNADEREYSNIRFWGVDKDKMIKSRKCTICGFYANK